MPHRVKAHNRRRRRLGPATVSNRHKADSVKALLGNPSQSPIAGLTAQAERHARITEWLEKQLPRALAVRITGVVERQDTLVIFTESAVWSARVRYAVAEIEPVLRQAFPQFSVVSVRVMPAA
jgi:hypothetical protein